MLSPQQNCTDLNGRKMTPGVAGTSIGNLKLLNTKIAQKNPHQCIETAFIEAIRELTMIFN